MACRQPLDRGPCRQVLVRTVFFHLPPVHCSLSWPLHQAICLKVNFRHGITSVTSFGSHQHEIIGHELKLWIQSFFLGAKALARNNTNYLIWCGSLLTMLWGNPFICHQLGFLYKCGDASNQGERQPLTSKNHQALQFKERSRLRCSSHC